MIKWAQRVTFGIYGLLLLAATLRAWSKFDNSTAATVFALGLAIGIVLLRAWNYVLGIVFGGRS